MILILAFRQDWFLLLKMQCSTGMFCICSVHLMCSIPVFQCEFFAKETLVSILRATSFSRLSFVCSIWCRQKENRLDFRRHEEADWWRSCIELRTPGRLGAAVGRAPESTRNGVSRAFLPSSSGHGLKPSPAVPAACSSCGLAGWPLSLGAPGAFRTKVLVLPKRFPGMRIYHMVTEAVP